MKLNLGCGNYPIAGYTNIDVASPKADIVGDFTRMRFEGVDEVEMSHSLEHLGWFEAPAVLSKIRGWMAPHGELRVEVPDIVALMEMSPSDPNFQQWMFGSQDHEGEVHRAGYSEESLRDLLVRCGFHVMSSRRFLSTHEARSGYPCLEVVAHA